MSKIDIERCERAMKELDIRGAPDTPERKNLIECAIAAIEENPAEAFKSGYFGIRNYPAAHYGDQRSDHDYGYGPADGAILFKIGRYPAYTGVLTVADCVYLLECVRDFGFFELYDPRYGKPLKTNLAEAILRLRKAEKVARLIRDTINPGVVEAHDAV